MLPFKASALQWCSWEAHAGKGAGGEIYQQLPCVIWPYADCVQLQSEWPSDSRAHWVCLGKDKSKLQEN